MDKLSIDIKRAAEICSEIEEGSTFGHPGLQKASEEWAVASLKVYQKELLHKALAISIAISNFLGELESYQS